MTKETDILFEKISNIKMLFDIMLQSLEYCNDLEMGTSHLSVLGDIIKKDIYEYREDFDRFRMNSDKILCNKKTVIH